MKARYAGARNSKADQEHIQGLHDHSAEMGARCFADNPNGLVKRLEADREEEAEKEAKAKKVNHSEQPDVASFAVELAQMKAAKEKLETQVAEMRRDTLRKEAAAFADEMVADHRAFPVEKKGLVELYLQAAFDDETGTKATALVSFGETKQPVNRVEALKIQYSTRPSHGMLTEEVIRAVEDPESEEARKFGILPAQRAAASASKGGKISAERRNHLLGLTPVGQSVLENGK